MAKNVVVHPYESELVEFARDELLRLICDELGSGRYRPDNAPIIEVPKGGGAIRPVHLLSLKDQLVYLLVGQRCLTRIATALGPRHRYTDFAHVVKQPPKPDDWFQPYFKPWREYLDRSAQLAEEAITVVETDISAFYENIQHKQLISDLRRVGVDEDVISLLFQCLNKWLPRSRGIPQGQPTSDLLSKLYLLTMDDELKNAGYSHLRFSDDIRLFAKSRVEAKKALQLLIRILREKTLNIQTAKTRFMRADEAYKEFCGVAPLIAEIQERFSASSSRASEMRLYYNSEYMSLADFLREAADVVEIPVEVFIEAYREYVEGRVEREFNKTTFHYLLGRLAKNRSPWAVSDCLGRFSDQPQETNNILDYFRAVGINYEDEARLMDFIEHDENIYSYQTYQLLKYLSESDVRDVKRCQSIARRYAFENSYPYVRAQARRLLAKIGEYSDIEALCRSLPEARGDLEVAELISGLGGLEKTRCVEMLTNFQAEGWLAKTAIVKLLGNLVAG